MNENKGMITVYYDGACPKCVKDRYHYEKRDGVKAYEIDNRNLWFYR